MKSKHNVLVKIARKLEVGDKLINADGKLHTITSVVEKPNRVIILFDEDLEIDFEPYQAIKVVAKKKLAKT